MARIRMVQFLAPALAVALFAGCDDGSSGGGGAGGTGGMTADGGMGGSGGAGGETDSMVQSLEITGDALSRYNDSQLTVTAIMADGSRMPVSEGVTWATSDEAIATVDAAGLAHGVKMGEVTLTASYQGVEGSWATTVGCSYPGFPNTVRFNNTMPALGWDDAHNPDGSQFRFSFEDFYCSEAYDQYTSIIVMLKAAWCAPCTQYARNRLNPAAASLRDDGALILYVEAQDLEYAPADSAYAYEHMRRIIGDGLGIRVGDASTIATVPTDVPVPAYLQETDLIEAFPTIFVVRRRDMRVIAESTRTQFSLPLQAIVNDLDADWSDPRPVFSNNCAEGDEEASEPNDTPEQATEIEAGEYQGGICTAEPDIYRVNIDGPWRATVDFSHAQGDIDVAVFRLGSTQADVSSNSNSDQEVVEFSGPANLMLFGYGGASATYTLTVEAR